MRLFLAYKEDIKAVNYALVSSFKNKIAFLHDTTIISAFAKCSVFYGCVCNAFINSKGVLQGYSKLLGENIMFFEQDLDIGDTLVIENTQVHQTIDIKLLGVYSGFVTCSHQWKNSDTLEFFNYFYRRGTRIYFKLQSVRLTVLWHEEADVAHFMLSRNGQFHIFVRPSAMKRYRKFDDCAEI
jgi:hypothetical protein